MTDQELKDRILVILRLEGRPLRFVEIKERLPGVNEIELDNILTDMFYDDRIVSYPSGWVMSKWGLNK